MSRWFEKYASNAQETALNNLMSGMKWATSAFAANPAVLAHLQESKRNLQKAIDVLKPPAAPVVSDETPDGLKP